jgi:uncharacterized protein (DUF1697 family)
MTKYIAFLRGINVGNIRIKMVDLIVAFEKMGCQSVKTYLQSGNIVFESDKNAIDIKSILEKGLTETFKYDAYVLVYEYSILPEIIAQYPFELAETHHAYVIFVDKLTIFEELLKQSENIEEAKNIAIGANQVIFWKVLIGDTLGTPFAKLLAKTKYKSSVTTRNINTLQKML